MEELSVISNYFNSCSLSDLQDTDDYAGPISVIRIVGSLLSMLGATSIIIAVFLTGRLSNPEIHPLFALSVGDFILSCSWLFGGALWINNESLNHHHADQDLGHQGLGLCYVLAITTTVISMVTSFLTVVYAFHAFVRMKQLVKSKGHISETKWLHHLMTALLYVVCWISPLILVVPVTESQVGLRKTNNACWCFIDFFNTRPGDVNVYNGNNTDGYFDDLATIIAVYTGLTFILCSLAIICLYASILWLARKVLKSNPRIQADFKSNRIIKKLMIRAAAFIGIYIMCGLPVLAGAIDVWKERVPLTLTEDSDKFILFWQAIFGPLQGFLNALVYGWSRKEFRRIILLPFTKLRERQKLKRRVADRQRLINNHAVSTESNDFYTT